MASLAQSGVTINRTWYTGMKRDQVSRNCTVVLSSMGTAANSIPASAFGLTYFEAPTVLTIADGSIVVVGAPSADRTKMLLKAAGSNTPADYSGTFTGVFTGR